MLNKCDKGNHKSCMAVAQSAFTYQWVIFYFIGQLFAFIDTEMKLYNWYFLSKLLINTTNDSSAVDLLKYILS